jgi:hypothetical protein
MATPLATIEEAKREEERWTEQLAELGGDRRFVHGLLLFGVIGGPAAHYFLNWVWALAAVGCALVLWASALYMVAVRQHEFGEYLERARERRAELEAEASDASDSAEDET